MIAIRRPRRILWSVAAALVVALIAMVGLIETSLRPDTTHDGNGATGRQGTPAQIDRGRHLAVVANCAGCHTARGGAPYGGGVPIDTPFGAIVAPNISPHDGTGIGRWSPDDFWHAVHDGIAPDGRPLSPAFPYTSYRRMPREDVDAIYFHLRAQAPVDQPRTEGSSGFPHNSRWALALWRMLFMPERIEAAPLTRTAGSGGTVGEPAVDDAQLLALGRYLALGPGHCSQCHSSRQRLGGWRQEDAFDGAPMPRGVWLAPPLRPGAWIGAEPVTTDAVAAALRSGAWSHGAAMGPMADIVATSLQHWEPLELRALARFLVSLEPGSDASAKRAAPPAEPATCNAPDANWGAAGQIYETQCARCHGNRGEGRSGMYPALCRNASLALPGPVNTIRAVLEGGYAPSTSDNPRPYGMPPFNAVLSDDEIATVVTQLRHHWSGSKNPPSPVSASDVRNSRSTWRP